MFGIRKSDLRKVTFVVKRKKVAEDFNKLEYL